MASELYGTVLEVATVNVGSVVTVDASVAATVLTLDDASVFDELGGRLRIEGSPLYDYISVDVDNNTITLATGLTVAATANETYVEVYPPAPLRTAMVNFGVAESEAVRVTIPHFFSGLPDGIRTGGDQEIALIEERSPGELYVQDVMTKGMSLLGASEDLDNYVAQGVFIQLSSTAAASGVNYPPEEYAGVLEVFSTRPSSVMMQRYTAYRIGSITNYPSSWIRAFGNDVWSAWEPLTGTRLYKVKTANEVVTTSTVLQNDNDLFLDLTVGAWDVEAKLSAISSGLTGDLKVNWTFSGTLSGAPAKLVMGPQLTSTDTSNTLMRAVNHAFTSDIPYGTDTVIGNYVNESFLMVVTAAGTLQLQWAQNGASGNTTMLPGSRLTATWVS